MEERKGECAHLWKQIRGLYSSGGGKKIQVRSRSACHVLRERKNLRLILRLMICLEDSCRLWLYTGRCEMEGAACYRVSGSSRVIRACSEVTKLQEGKDQNRTSALAPLRKSRRWLWMEEGSTWKISWPPPRILSLLPGFELHRSADFHETGGKGEANKGTNYEFCSISESMQFFKVTHLLI